MSIVLNRASAIPSRDRESTGQARNQASLAVTRPDRAQPAFSVVICTFNGASRIERVLTALAELNDGASYEIILVDNCSTDGIAALASAIWQRIGKPLVDLKVIVEPTPGVAFARRTGARAATGEFVLFCDDDNLLAPDYLQIAASIMADETIGAAGGASTPVVSDGDISPLLFSWGGHYAIGAQAPASGDIHVLWGAGMVVRTKLVVPLYEMPGFPLMVGRKGSALTTGEDTEIVHCVALSGYRIWYDERLTFRHIVRRERMTEAYLKGLWAGGREARPMLGRYSELRKIADETFRQRIRSIVWALVRIPAFTGRNDYRLFGLIARFGMTFLMTSEERAMVDISSALRRGRRDWTPVPGKKNRGPDALHLAMLPRR
jgi:glycosyltransferase involved in cell wall biosynthesis